MKTKLRSLEKRFSELEKEAKETILQYLNDNGGFISIPKEIYGSFIYSPKDEPKIDKIFIHKDLDYLTLSYDNGKLSLITSTEDFQKAVELLSAYEDLKESNEREKEVLLKEISFDNEDIIITDPCYIVKDDYDWSLCDCGSNMEALGITNFLCHDTLYGDWSCTTSNTDTSEKIGKFCADAGQVIVCSLKDALKINPDFDYHTTRPWTTTLIKGFTGKVHFEIEHTGGIYDEDETWVDNHGNTHYLKKKGEAWSNDSLHVIGNGNINFKTNQTGF